MQLLSSTDLSHGGARIELIRIVGVRRQWCHARLRGYFKGDVFTTKNWYSKLLTLHMQHTVCHRAFIAPIPCSPDIKSDDFATIHPWDLAWDSGSAPIFVERQFSTRMWSNDPAVTSDDDDDEGVHQVAQQTRIVVYTLDAGGWGRWNWQGDYSSLAPYNRLID